MNKVVVLDYGMYSHKAIFAWRNQKNIPVEYTCLKMIISHLQKIGISPMDEVIIACEGEDNWRKQYSKEYKANRQDYRESFEDIDWNLMYQKMRDLLEKIELGTFWRVLRVNNCEADDIAAISCKFFKDKEIVLVADDKDWEMLWYFDNVKIFSPLKKYKGRKGMYKVKPKNFNVYELISKKIKKEVSDNLVSPILTAEDYELREMLVSLIKLPDFIEFKIINVLSNIKEKEWNIDLIPFQSLRPTIEGLYNATDKVLPYEECVRYNEYKENKKKKKKAKKRRKNV